MEAFVVLVVLAIGTIVFLSSIVSFWRLQYASRKEFPRRFVRMLALLLIGGTLMKLAEFMASRIGGPA